MGFKPFMITHLNAIFPTLCDRFQLIGMLPVLWFSLFSFFMLLKNVYTLLKIDFHGFEVIVYFITGVFSVLVRNRCSALTVDSYSSLCYSQMLIPPCCSNNSL